MILSYGHDDRVCSYAGVKALLDSESTLYTCVALCVDKEEVGSNGNTGMHSKFFENAVSELIALEGNYCELKLKRAMANSKVLSADVSAGYNPNYSDAYQRETQYLWEKV